MGQTGILIVFSFLLLSCNNVQENEKSNQDRYEKSKKTIQELEKENPVKFLSLSTSDKHNLIGQTVIKGTIKSKATVVTYKDVVLVMNFMSKTGSLLNSEEHTVDEFIKPGEEKDFKMKLFAPKGAEDVQIKIKSAGFSKD